jgi:hypothetical protein
MKRIDDRGAAGIFEDLPSFMIILVALSIFISSLFYSSFVYIKAQQMNQDYESCMELLRELENYEEILVEGDYTRLPIKGIYSFEKLNEMNTTIMKEDITSEFEFNVNITDLTNPSSSWSFGDELPSGRIEKLGMSSTVLIRMSENSNRLARLEVTIW